MKKLLLFLTVVTYSFLTYAEGNEPKPIELTDSERQLVESNNNFAFNLFRKARGEESSIMSPLSITYALGMMNNGAAGQTQQEINEVLGFGDAGADAINQFCRKLLTEAPTLDETTAAEIANTVFVNSGQNFYLQQGFIDKANEFYDAEPQAINFYERANALNIINGWANDHTHGMIPEILDNQTFDSDANSYLLNALYFKGKWTNPFDKMFTHDESFNGGQTVPMMHQMAYFQYTENDLYQAICLPYGNAAYSMTVFLPREGKTIDDVLGEMNGENWETDKFSPYIVDLKLPRFQTGTLLPLTGIMSELGMPLAFNRYLAEFPYFGTQPVFISNMLQKAVIDLDEEGTEAAAVTVIITVSTSCGDMPKTATFYANRPFFYTISEQSTGAILFIGQYLGQGLASSIDSFTPNFSPGIEIVNGKLSNGKWFDLQGRQLSGKPARGIYIEDGKKKVMK